MDRPTLSGLGKAGAGGQWQPKLQSTACCSCSITPDCETVRTGGTPVHFILLYIYILLFFVMLDEGVHRNLQCGQIPGSLLYGCLLGLSLLLRFGGYQGEALASSQGDPFSTTQSDSDGDRVVSNVLGIPRLPCAELQNNDRPLGTCGSPHSGK
jgi:hypothetical protein